MFKKYIPNIQSYLLLLIAFSMPFLGIKIKVTSIAIGLLVIASIPYNSFKTNFSNRRKTTLLVSLAAIYILHLIGLVYTENFKYAKFDLEVKSTLLLFPVVFLLLDISKEQIKKIVLFFIIGCLVTCLLSLFNAILNYPINGINSFFYQDYSLFMHPAYFAMYLNFVLILLLFSKKSSEELISKKWVRVLIIVFIVANIVLLSSKAGIITSFFIFFSKIITSSLQEKNWRKGMLQLGIIFLTPILIYLSAPPVKSRIDNALNALTSEKLDKKSSESTSVRIEIWQIAASIISDNFLLGVGTGDVKDELLTKYETEGISGAKEHTLNAHNVFIQLFISLGLIGFLIISFNLGAALKISLADKDYVFLALIILLIINFLTESMLETQAGVIFYSFFYSLLASKSS